MCRCFSCALVYFPIFNITNARINQTIFLRSCILPTVCDKWDRFPWKMFPLKKFVSDVLEKASCCVFRWHKHTHRSMSVRNLCCTKSWYPKWVVRKLCMQDYVMSSIKCQHRQTEAILCYGHSSSLCRSQLRNYYMRSSMCRYEIPMLCDSMHSTCYCGHN